MLERNEYKNEMMEQGREIQDKYEFLKASVFVCTVIGLVIILMNLFG